MYKTMHEKANAKTAKSNATRATQNTAPAPITCTSQTQPPITRSSASNTNAAPTKLDKTLFDLLTDVTVELIVEDAQLSRIGRKLKK